MFFTQTKLEEIDTDAIRVFTSPMGYNKNMAKSSPAAGHNINVGGTRLPWKMSLVAFHILKHDG
eukprot:8740576-Ditylum_brightwellii.AAC.1